MSEGITEVEVFVEQIDVQKNEEGYVCHVMIFLLEILFKDSFVIFLFIQLFIHSLRNQKRYVLFQFSSISYFLESSVWTKLAEFVPFSLRIFFF